MKNRYLKNLAVPAIALALLTGGNALAGGYVDADFDAATFSTPLNINNPYWPLNATGYTFHYYAEEGEDECVITETTITNMDYMSAVGVNTRIIREVEWLDEDCTGSKDVILEETDDWYGQDDDGNIWYFGEDTLAYEYDDEGNFLGTTPEGSWEAGVDGAEAGIVMLGDPMPGLFYRQEFLEDEAEDMGKVLRLNTKVSIDLGDFDGCLKTKEWTILEPGHVEHKYYCPGFGLVYVEELKEKTVYVELVAITN
jgi:hypothetical protein